MKNEKKIRKWMKAISLMLAVFLLAGGMARDAAASVQFPDVMDKNAYYYNSVYWAVNTGVADGKNGYFKPDDACTRAEAVSFLYKLAGKPDVTGTSKFPDVNPGDWFYKPVLWAVKNGITNGYGSSSGVSLFKPYEKCQRSMIVTFIKHYAESVDKIHKAAVGTEPPFPDVPNGEWFTNTVRWAAENGIANGKGNGNFAPYENCTRAQIVCFIRNYVRFRDAQKESGKPIELPEIPI